MNLCPGGKQKKLCNTIIPLNNPEPAPGEEDTCGKVQHMCFPEDHEDPQLQGQPKEIKAVLEERKSVWDKYNGTCMECGMKVSKKCASCTKSQVLKDAEHHVAKAAEMEQLEDVTSMDETAVPEIKIPPAVVDIDEWCCMYQVLSLQDNFLKEKPMIQSLIEEAGHVCLFLLRFHCELNAIEMLWGYAKHRV